MQGLGCKVQIWRSPSSVRLDIATVFIFKTCEGVPELQQGFALCGPPARNQGVEFRRRAKVRGFLFGLQSASVDCRAPNLRFGHLRFMVRFKFRWSSAFGVGWSCIASGFTELRV